MFFYCRRYNKPWKLRKKIDVETESTIGLPRVFSLFSKVSEMLADINETFRCGPWKHPKTPPKHPIYTPLKIAKHFNSLYQGSQNTLTRFFSRVSVHLIFSLNHFLEFINEPQTHQTALIRHQTLYSHFRIFVHTVILISSHSHCFKVLSLFTTFFIFSFILSFTPPEHVTWATSNVHINCIQFASYRRDLEHLHARACLLVVKILMQQSYESNAVTKIAALELKWLAYIEDNCIPNRNWNTVHVGCVSSMVDLNTLASLICDLSWHLTGLG